MVVPQNHDAELKGECFEAGDLRIDVGQQCVTRVGETIPLPNLSFKLLLALLRAAPNFLDNEELMRRGLPGLLVRPETVSKRVALLREALGDDPKQPRYLAGLRSRGYRIAASVASCTPTSAATAQPMLSPPPSEFSPPVNGADEKPFARPRRTRYGLAAAVIALAVLVTLMLAHRRPTQEARGVRLQASAAVDERSRTVAVLPFDNISANPSDAYLALGVPEILINRLSSVPAVLTIARSSSFAVAVQKLDPVAIGQRLNAGYLIEGSVQRDGERLRIAVELIEAASGKLVWADRFDRQLSEILRVEDEIG